MTDAVLDRYTDALRQGHQAVLRGRPKHALAQYGLAASLADHRALPHLSSGSVLLQLGRARDALAAYDRAVARGPSEVVAHRGRAAALAALGRASEARAAEREAERLGAVADLARSFAHEQSRAAARREGPEALVVEAEELMLAGDARGALSLLVSASDGYARRGELDAALDACGRGLTLDAGSVAIHLQMVRCYLGRGWNDRAVERLVLLDRMLDLEGDDRSRDDLRTLCGQARDLDPRLERIASMVETGAS